MLAADVIFAAAHIFYMRELYTFSMVFLLLTAAPLAVRAWRQRLAVL